MPLLDVLQSVPILSFLPVVLLSLSAVLPAAAAPPSWPPIVLIFTSQAWNMTYSFYQSMTTIPMELREAAAIFRLESLAALQDARAALRRDRPDLEQHDELGGRMVLPDGGRDLPRRRARLPPARPGLVPADGRQRRRPARPSWLGIATLVLVIVLLDQLVWRPVLAWADKFKLEMVEGDEPPELVVLRACWSRSSLVERFGSRLWIPLTERIDAWMRRRLGQRGRRRCRDGGPRTAPRPVVTVAGDRCWALVLAYGGCPRRAACWRRCPRTTWAAARPSGCWPPSLAWPPRWRSPWPGRSRSASLIGTNRRAGRRAAAGRAGGRLGPGDGPLPGRSCWPC